MRGAGSGAERGGMGAVGGGAVGLRGGNGGSATLVEGMGRFWGGTAVPAVVFWGGGDRR